MQRGSGLDTVKQWSINELTFVASKRPAWNVFPLCATFRNGSTQVAIDGYWDGGQTWRVRFTLPHPGAWEWTTTSPDPGLDGETGSLLCEPPSEVDIERNPNYRGHLRISDSGRYFTYADGTPFLYLGDTCWEMNETRCGLGDNEDGPFYVWMNDRKRKGFTVVNHWIYASGHPRPDQEIPSSNEGGGPFAVEDGAYVFDEIEAPYYQHTDQRWRALWTSGFVMAGPPTWFAKPRHCMTLEQAQSFSRYVMARYGAFNLVWALSGEYSFGAHFGHVPWDQTETWNALGSSVAAHNPYHHPISIHPGPANFHASSSVEFHHSGWLDHNWLQTGQYPEGLHRVAVWARADHERAPTRPVLHAEGYYESFPDPPGRIAANSYQARFQPWVAFLNGACGAVYGACSIWCFHEPSDPRSYYYRDGSDWRTVLDLDGARQMKHIADFLNALEWWELVPQRERIMVNGSPAPIPTDEDISPPHCAAIEGKVYVIYVPEGNAANTLTLSQLPGGSIIAQWYDPRTGAYRSINAGKPVEPDGENRYTLPPRPSPSDGDWVCLIELVKFNDQLATQEVEQ